MMQDILLTDRISGGKLEMKPSAVVYTSNMGHTRQYAVLLGKEIGVPVYSYDEAVSRLPGGSHIIYLAGIRQWYKEKM